MFISRQIIFYIILPSTTRTPDNSNFFLFPLKVRIIGSRLYSAARRIFNTLLSVSSGDETLRLMLDILFQPDWKISNGTLNGPIVTSTHILEHSWGPRTRTPGLSRRRTVQKFSFVCGAGYHRFKTPKFSQSKLAGMNDHLSETTAITFWSWNCYIIPFRWATYLEIQALAQR